LNDLDEYGHLSDYPKYISTLSLYDKWLSLLTDFLGLLGEYGKNTTIVLTTDHGRGDGEWWFDHGGAHSIEPARPVWLASRGNCTPPTGEFSQSPGAHSHLSIRPTIEKLFGLMPETSGTIFEEVTACI